MDIKRLVELNIIKQAINDAHEVHLSTEVETDSEAGTHHHEVIIGRENYGLYLSVSYDVIGKIVSSTHEQPAEDNRELGMVTVDEIRLHPADSDIDIELGEYENTLVKSIKFV